MNKSDFWQSVKLSQEMEIAGGFIYDGLYLFDKIDNFDLDTELFPVLYNISIGIERFLKILIILKEFNEASCIKCFEKNLKTHNHINLYNKLQNSDVLLFSDQEVDFLKLLDIFYNKQRYDRLTLSLVSADSKELRDFLSFLGKHIGYEYSSIGIGSFNSNNQQVKEFLGVLINSIARKSFEQISKLALLKNIYTNEYRADSKLAKIIYPDQSISFLNEKRALLEAFIYLINDKNNGDVLNSIKDMIPLQLDPGLDQDYLSAILNQKRFEIQQLIDEVEFLQEELPDIKERIHLLDDIIESI